MIRAADLARQAAGKVRTPAIPYVLGGRSEQGTDCINLVGWCVQELGGGKDDVPRGSNTAWRQAMQWAGTLAEARAQGRLVPGALLFIRDAPTDKWPDGDYGHVGVYIGQAGLEVVHASASRGGVYPSTLKNGWTHVAWLKVVDHAAKNEGGGSTVATVVKARVVTASGDLNLRSTPEITGTNRIGSIPQGALVDVVDSSGAWWQVRYGGRAGWVSAAYLQAEDPLERLAQLLQQAQEALQDARRA